MPLIRSSSTGGEPLDEQALTGELSSELNAELDLGKPVRQPVIIENEIGQTNTLHVVAVWERWKLVPAGQRSRIIVRAYEAAAPDRVDRITIAMGVTLEEAIDLGLMPYKIVPTVRKDDGMTEEQIVAMMRQEGAVATQSGFLLRFPSEQAALAAYDRLAGQSAPEFWAVSQEEPRR